MSRFGKCFRNTRLAVLILCLFLFSGTQAMAAPGDLDTEFGTDGKVRTAVPGTSGGRSTAIQSDGKIVVAGYANNGADGFALVRYETDGTVDTGFGTNGMVTTVVGVGQAYGFSVAIQDDGKIVVAGSASNGTDNDFAAVRYNSDGSLDTGFGTDGKVITAVGPGNDKALAVAIQADGKIVAAGESWFGSQTELSVVRYNPDGSLDTGFGTDGTGKVRTVLGSSYSCGNSVAIQDDGKIVVAGYANSGEDDFAVVRYNSDGSLDTGFGTDGKVITAVGSGRDKAQAAAIQDDGKIVAAGYANGDFAVVRYDGTGALDAGFGTNGIVTTDLGSGYDYCYSMAIQNNGKIVLAGSAPIGADNDFAVVRYGSDGALDTGFGTDGLVTTNFGDGHDVGYSVVIQENGRIVVAGYSSNGTDNDFAVVRYLGDLPPTVTTSEVSAITSNSASCGGNVTDGGSSTVTARGVCWGTASNPTTDDSMTSDGSGLGEFSSQLTGLNPNTLYYLRAYATNSMGTSYGEEKSFTTGGSSQSFTVTVEKNGGGGGTVTSSPSGIDCGGSCQAVFDQNTALTLSPTADAGSAFSGWSLSECPGNGDCHLTLGEDTSVTATFDPDEDGDGISDNVENAGPNNGDGNSDGILDSLQDEVASFPDISGAYVTLVTEAGTLNKTLSTAYPGTTELPDGWTFPAGFFGFSITGLDSGASVQVTFLLHQQNPNLTTYYRYGPTPDDTTPHWYSFLKGEGTLGATITQDDAVTRIVLYLTDGQKGDDDLTANGTIADPGGPGEVQRGGLSGGGIGGCFLEAF